MIEALKKLKEPCVWNCIPTASMSLTFGKGLGMGLEEAGLDQIRQKACTERRPLKRLLPLPNSSGPLSLGQGTQHQFPQQTAATKWQWQNPQKVQRLRK